MAETKNNAVHCSKMGGRKKKALTGERERHIFDLDNSLPTTTNGLASTSKTGENGKRRGTKNYILSNNLVNSSGNYNNKSSIKAR